MNKSMHQRERVRLALIVMAFMMPSLVAILFYLISRVGIISEKDTQLILDIVSLLFAFYISVFTGYLSWRALIFAAVPRIDVEYLGEEKTGKKKFKPSENVSLKFKLKNIGWWYAKPASTGTEIFLNFDKAISLKRARYGSQGELVEETVRPGKKNGNYLWIKGMLLYYGEEGEDIIVDMVTPSKTGSYDGWVTGFSLQTTYGVYNFTILVEAE